MHTAARWAEATCVRCRRSAAGDCGWRFVAQASGLKDCAVERRWRACCCLEPVDEDGGEDGWLDWDNWAPVRSSWRRTAGNEEQWLPSSSCSSDRAPVEKVSLGTRPIEQESVEPRMSKLA